MKKKLTAILAVLALVMSVGAAVFASENSADTVSNTEPVQELSAPTIQFPAEPTNSSVTVTVTTADSLDENGKLYYSIAGGEWTEYTQSFAVTENAEISAKVVNGKGTQSPLATAKVECIDKTAPTAPTIVPATTAWTNKEQGITLVSGTDADSGYLRTEYKIGADGTWIEYYGEFKVNTACVVYARTVDKAQNCSEEVSMSIANFDMTPPDISLLSVTFGNEKGALTYGTSNFSSFFTGSVTCSIDGATDSQSGIAYYEFQLVESGAYISEAGWNRYDPKNKPVFDKDFIGNVYARAVDNAGNVSREIPSAGVVLDSTPPVIGEINKSTSAITDENVTVTFNVTDNISILNVTVNGEYVGIYAPTFTVFRNGEYVIVAKDKAGNESTATVVINNIQTTPFNILKIAKSLREEEYTPSTWINMQKYAAELDNLISIQADETIINSAAEQLTAALEALVRKGDRTYANELLERVKTVDKTVYTDTSWSYVDQATLALEAVIADDESAQQHIDEAQAALESAMKNLVLIANFTSLDRIIGTVEGIDPTPYPKDRYDLLIAKVEEAKALVRTDTDQQTADRYYSEILTLMGELNMNTIPDEEDRIDEGVDLVHVMIIGIAVLVAALAIAIILIIKRAPKRAKAAQEEDMAYYYEASSRKPHTEVIDQDEEPEYESEQYEPYVSRQERGQKPASFGDIQFSDEGEFSDWE